ncbi:MAG TPA: PASTA domain-containing protein [Candidatus Acidoferrales bacterium]|nr:PASTA domain-containing protein [Candidatus Acidoferrales bacterium]
MKALFLALLLTGTASALNLPIPPGYPILLGRSCGSVFVASYIEGFDTAGNVHGELRASTRCPTSGRGGGSITYTSYHAITWDFFGGYVLSAYDGGALNPAEVAVDAYGNVAQVVNNVPTLTLNYLPPTAKHIAAIVPVTAGKAQAIATAQLTALGFVPSITYVYTGTAPAGSVLYTTPAAGLMEPVGAAIQVVVSLGGGNND